jgi:hypothetical protein
MGLLKQSEHYWSKVCREYISKRINGYKLKKYDEE